MTAVLDRPTVETIDETTLKGEPACEFKHVGSICSVEVTHAMSNCRGHRPVCDVAAQKSHFRLKGFESSDRCACGSPILDCWRIWAT
jgi:hypothetical protein